MDISTTKSALHTLDIRDRAFYGWSAAFIIGNLALPQLCHLASMGGKAFLPIYFFTLIGAYRCGWKVGVLTALASPLLNSLLFGMPAPEVLTPIVVKSLLIAALTPLIVRHCKGYVLPALLLIVGGYQLLGGLFEWAWTGSLSAAVQDIRLGWPGMVFQVVGGWLILLALGKNNPETPNDTATPAQ
ncbi:MAG: hypothetical protein LBV12_05895 [Puniceicoccales bacterium]|jgi:hypothetical protein|nr:hypothetical protein [Puniceicoccales bacterium]